MKKMVLAFAHPDDESFLVGATIAKYAKAGWDIHLICATSGEVGQSGEYGNVTHDELGSIRRKELEKAATLLGVSSITFLGFTDGTLKDEPSGELEEKIHQKLLEEVPDCVITFDTTGYSNHPDHVRMCFATTFAFQKYAFWIEKKLKDSTLYDEKDAPKLYYACAPESVVSYLQKKNILPMESFGKRVTGVEDKLVTTVVGTSGFERIKKQALREHKTQAEDVDRFLSLPRQPLMKSEYFIFRMHGTREIFMGKNDRVSTKL